MNNEHLLQLIISMLSYSMSKIAFNGWKKIVWKYIPFSLLMSWCVAWFMISEILHRARVSRDLHLWSLFVSSAEVFYRLFNNLILNGKLKDTDFLHDYPTISIWICSPITDSDTFPKCSYLSYNWH